MAFVAPLPLSTPYQRIHISTWKKQRLKPQQESQDLHRPTMRVYVRPSPPHPPPKLPPERPRYPSISSPATTSRRQGIVRTFSRKQMKKEEVLQKLVQNFSTDVQENDEMEKFLKLRAQRLRFGQYYENVFGRQKGKANVSESLEHEIMSELEKRESREKERKLGGMGTFAVRGGLRYMYQPPPPYCAVNGTLEDHVRALDGRVWYMGVAGRNKVVRALELLEDCRDIGEEIVSENVMVAAIVADLQMDCETVCAAVLRNCLGGIYGVDADVVGNEVGMDVVRILQMNEKVNGVVDMVRRTELEQNGNSKPLDEQGDEEYAALRELMLAVVDDPRAISLQLASAVVIMRSLGRVEFEEGKDLLARQALKLYAPVAHQLGIWFIQSELEELAFMQLHPTEYEDIRKLVGARLKESRHRLQEYKEQLERAICGSSAVVNNARSIRVKGRVKGIYSTYRKMKRSHKQVDEIYDLLALRVLVQPRGGTEEDEYRVCYDILEAVKSHFSVIERRSKDYISHPKPNGYKSLHETICPTHGLPAVEIQIRTEKMHHVAEFGAAAHWIYQEDRRKSDIATILSGEGTQDENDIDGDGNGGNGKLVTGEESETSIEDLQLPDEDIFKTVSGRLSHNEELKITHSRRKGYLRYVSAAIRKSWVIVNSCGKLYRMAVGSNVRDLLSGMGLASLNAIVTVNGSVAPLTRQLEMNDLVRFVSDIS